MNEDHPTPEDDLPLGNGIPSEDLPDETPAPPDAGSRQGPSPLVIVAAIAAVLVALAAVYFFFLRSSTEPAPLPEVAQPAPPPLEPEGEIEPLDEALPDPPESLEASDAYLREIASRLSSHPQLAEWVVPENLLRRAVVAVDNVSRGENPKKHVEFLEPEGEFEVRHDGPETTIDRSTYARYDVLTGVFISLDTDVAAAAYRRLEPLLDRAYQDLGYPGADFDTALRGAIEHLLATPIPAGEPELVLDVSTWKYEDPELENSSPAQKQLLRLGPENARRVQRKLARLADALGLETN